MKRCLLPFWGKRKLDIDMLVLHSVAMSPEEAVDVFKQFKVSCHYIIAEDGEIWQLTSQKRWAWHAGISRWRDMEDINSRSIGIEFCSKNLGQFCFSDAQKEAGIKLLHSLVDKYKIKSENIVGHSDIAPARKADPGKAFFWKELADEGIGIWYDIRDADKMFEDDVAKLLHIIGYDIKNLKAAASAFCRHFYPERVCVVEDVWQIEKNVCLADDDLLIDSRFIKILKAVAYAYCNASNTPCKM